MANYEIRGPAAIALSKLAITGTASTTTFLRGDGAWALPTASTASALPTYAGTPTGPFDPTRSLYNFRGSNTLRIRAGLGRASAGSGLFRVLAVGDSVTAGQGAAPGVSDPISGVRKILAGMGYPVGGLSWIYNGTGRDARWTSVNWQTDGSQDSPYVVGATSATATFVSDTPGTVLEILTTGVTAAFRYAIDGGAAVTISPSGAAAPQLITVAGLADTAHTVVFTAAASGDSYLAAAGIRPATGVAYGNAAIAGSTTDHWLGEWFEPMTMALAMDPDLVTIELGLNDAFNAVAAGTFSTTLTGLVNQAKASGSDVLLVASHGPDPAVITATIWNNYLSTLYSVADATGVPLLDITDRLGRYADLVAYGISTDDLHLNAAGYASKAHALSSTLLWGARSTAAASAGSIGSTTVTANTQTGTAYTLALADAGKVVEMNNASANTVTVPTNASVAFPTGTIIEVAQYGAGQTTLAAASGVTLRTPASLATRTRYGTIALRKRATNEWVVSGDLG